MLVSYPTGDITTSTLPGSYVGTLVPEGSAWSDVASHKQHTFVTDHGLSTQPPSRTFSIPSTGFIHSESRLLAIDSVPRPQVTRCSSMDGLSMPAKSFSVSCEVCGLVFTGEYNRGSLARHRRQKHGEQEQAYSCADEECERVFKRQDARLKHYRRKHPHLAPNSALQRHNTRDSATYNTSPSQVVRLATRSLQHEHRVEFQSDDIQTMALPDTCSAVNIVSEQVLSSHSVTFDEKTRTVFELPNGKPLTSIGTAYLNFRLGGDESLHFQPFAVIRNCVHDVILGNWLLGEIEIFTKFCHNLKWIQRDLSAPTPRVCSVGRPQQVVKGSINGHVVSAAPDTGSDINLISEEFAKIYGFTVDTTQECINLSFVDGTTARTCGFIPSLEWSFDLDEKVTSGLSKQRASARAKQRILAKSLPPTIRDWDFDVDAAATDVYDIPFYVVENLTTPIILGSDLLLGSNAFKVCAQNFWVPNPSSKPTIAGLRSKIGVIRTSRKQKDRWSLSKLLRRGTPAGKTPTHNLHSKLIGEFEVVSQTGKSDRTRHETFDKELLRRGEELDRIANLPPNECAAAEIAEKRRQLEWSLSQKPRAGDPERSADSLQQPVEPSAVHQISTEATSPPPQSQPEAQSFNVRP
jgi:hypothetical protein